MADKPLDAVIADLTHETASWGAIGAQVAMEQTVQGRVTRAREGYMAARHGERRYAEFSRAHNREVCVVQAYDDTTRCASVRFGDPVNPNRQTSITISKTFLDEAATGFAKIPDALPFFVGLVPIRTAIATARALGPSRVAGRDCTRHLCRAVPGPAGTQDLVYHLDAATSYPLKVETFLNEAHVAAGTPYRVWEADRLDEVQGFHVATDSRLTTFNLADPAHPIPDLVNKYHVDSIRFNEAIPITAFWPVADPGVLVTDTITGRSAYNTADGKAPSATTLDESPSGGLPWVSWAGTGGVTLGLALLVVGLGRWARGR